MELNYQDPKTINQLCLQSLKKKPRMKRKYKLSYISEAHNWFKPPKMIIKKENNVFSFQAPKYKKLNLTQQYMSKVLLIVTPQF